MNTVETILSRRSVRKYTDKPISEEDVHTILRCAMSGPSAVNARDWNFIVVNDKNELQKWSEASGRAGKIMGNAAMCVLITGDLNRAFLRAPEYWVINGAIAGQNMVLAAKSLGIGSVWLGIWPQMDKVEVQKNYFNLPEDQIPHSIIAFGYPEDENSDQPHPDYEESQVHFNKW